MGGQQHTGRRAPAGYDTDKGEGEPQRADHTPKPTKQAGNGSVLKRELINTTTGVMPSSNTVPLRKNNVNRRTIAKRAGTIQAARIHTQITPSKVSATNRTPAGLVPPQVASLWGAGASFLAPPPSGPQGGEGGDWSNTCSSNGCSTYACSTNACSTYGCSANACSANVRSVHAARC